MTRDRNLQYSETLPVSNEIGRIIQVLASLVMLQNVWSHTIYTTGFAKGGLSHTSNFINLEDHNFVVKRDMKLKLSPAIKLRWYFLLTKFQVNTLYQSEVTNRQSG